MNNAYFQMKPPVNEPVKGYLPGSPERAALKAELERQLANPVEVPMIIGGKTKVSSSEIHDVLARWIILVQTDFS